MPRKSPPTSPPLLLCSAFSSFTTESLILLLTCLRPLLPCTSVEQRPESTDRIREANFRCDLFRRPPREGQQHLVASVRSQLTPGAEKLTSSSSFSPTKNFPCLPRHMRINNPLQGTICPIRLSRPARPGSHRTGPLAHSPEAQCFQANIILHLPGIICEVHFPSCKENPKETRTLRQRRSKCRSRFPLKEQVKISTNGVHKTREFSSAFFLVRLISGDLQ